MKVTAFSDIHGYLPDVNTIEKSDVICIAGDIVPLNIQRDTIKSVVWITREFVPWCMSLPCEKVILIAGNHDFVFQNIVNNYTQCFSYLSQDEKERMYSDIVKDNLLLPKKIVYLSDTEYTYNHKKFYGTPWIPELSNWAFYKSSDGLKKVFEKIPENVDVLITHSAGRYVNDTGVSLQNYSLPEYGSQELSDAVQKVKPKYWLNGHIHSGNHKLSQWNDINVACVSLKDEDYKINYEPLTFEI